MLNILKKKRPVKDDVDWMNIDVTGDFPLLQGFPVWLSTSLQKEVNSSYEDWLDDTHVYHAVLERTEDGGIIHLDVEWLGSSTTVKVLFKVGKDDFDKVVSSGSVESLRETIRDRSAVAFVSSCVIPGLYGLMPVKIDAQNQSMGDFIRDVRERASYSVAWWNGIRGKSVDAETHDRYTALVRLCGMFK